MRSWYSSVYMEGDTSEWCVTANKKAKISSITIGGHDSWTLYGPFPVKAILPKPSFLYWNPIITVRERSNAIGEHVLLNYIDKLDFYVNCQPEHRVYEFENLEELRLFDQNTGNHSDNEAMRLVSQVFHVKESAIRNIRCLKAGMTNKSFLFEVNNEHYICRIPGPGTELLINRKEEEASCHAVEPLDITEHIIYFDGDNRPRAKYYEGSRNADAKTGMTSHPACPFCASASVGINGGTSF